MARGSRPPPSPVLVQVLQGGQGLKDAVDGRLRQVHLLGDVAQLHRPVAALDEVENHRGAFERLYRAWHAQLLTGSQL